ncbi:uncharacterized protein LOC110859993 [Folsomia candida]|uniref:uncharacterized protein LOC110859993 n=1 Tax=Folsomia candida TaxID=158441 RepID=UPI000B907433|nr:uncharacterized protein LOC110859993 [Folsomia candida]
MRPLTLLITLVLLGATLTNVNGDYLLEQPQRQLQSHPVIITQSPGAERRNFGNGLFEIDHHINNMLYMMPWSFHLGYPPLPLIPPPMHYPGIMGNQNQGGFFGGGQGY